MILSTLNDDNKQNQQGKCSISKVDTLLCLVSKQQKKNLWRFVLSLLHFEIQTSSLIIRWIIKIFFSIIEFALIRFLMHQICWIFFSFFPSLINLGESFRQNRSLPTVAGFGIVESFTFVRSVCFFFDLNPLHSNCLRPIARLDAW